MGNNIEITVTGIVIDEIEGLLIDDIREFCLENMLRILSIELFEDEGVEIKISIWNSASLIFFIYFDNDCYIKCNTSKFGPGYHKLALSKIEQLCERFLTNYDIQDPTSYYFHEDFKQLQNYFKEYAKGQLEILKPKIKKYKKGYFDKSHWNFLPILNENEIATPIGIKHINDFFDDQLNIKEVKIENIFPWNNFEFDLQDIYNKALFNIWNFWTTYRKTTMLERWSQFESVFHIERLAEITEEKRYLSLPKLIYKNIKDKKWEKDDDQVLEKIIDNNLYDSYLMRNSLVNLGKLQIPFPSYYSNWEFVDNTLVLKNRSHSEKCNPTMVITNLKQHNFVKLNEQIQKGFKTIDDIKEKNFFLNAKFKKIWTNRYQIIGIFSHNSAYYEFNITNSSKKNILREWQGIKTDLQKLYQIM
ncbi:hypothetical protein ACJA25_01750 [Mycoplasmopsis hyopharyngis]|uniref:hypothetical protein n=1 Tax=Mycoplasmopsis hyopharyngis TaxID=29558 RepID=UPI003872B5E6